MGDSLMLMDMHVPWRIIVPLILACVLPLTSFPLALAAPLGQRFIGPAQHYLALGDSLAYGLQPNLDHTHGYVDDFFTFLQAGGSVKDHMNLGCPREASVSFITGSLCSPDLINATPQLSTALGYLQSYAGQVSPVTLDIGADDLLGDIDLTTCKVSDTFTADLKRLDNILTQYILPALHNALIVGGRPTGDVLMLNYYDPYQNLCPGTVKDVENLNNDLAQDVKGFATLVDIFTAFGGAKTPNQKICDYTGMCKANPSPLLDIHPNTQGYQVIAKAIEDVYPNTNHADQFPQWSGNSVFYAVGSVVAYKNSVYECKIAHTSQPNWDPADAVSLWN